MNPFPALHSYNLHSTCKDSHATVVTKYLAKQQHCFCSDGVITPIVTTACDHHVGYLTT